MPLLCSSIFQACSFLLNISRYIQYAMYKYTVYLSTHCWLLYRNAAVLQDPESLFFFNSQLKLQGIIVHDVKNPLKQINKYISRSCWQCQVRLLQLSLSSKWLWIVDKKNFCTVSSKVHKHENFWLGFLANIQWSLCCSRNMRFEYFRVFLFSLISYHSTLTQPAEEESHSVNILSKFRSVKFLLCNQSTPNEIPLLPIAKSMPKLHSAYADCWVNFALQYGIHPYHTGRCWRTKYTRGK